MGKNERVPATELQSLYIELVLAWHCDCGCYNEDSFLETARPFCEDCLQDYRWDDIISHEEMDRANQFVIRVEQSERQQEVTDVET